MPKVLEEEKNLDFDTVIDRCHTKRDGAQDSCSGHWDAAVYGCFQ